MSFLYLQMSFVVYTGDEFSAAFLIEHHADVNLTTYLDKESSFHMVANFNPEVTGSEVMSGMARLAQKMIDHDADPNLQDAAGRLVWYIFHMMHTNILCCMKTKT